MAGVAYQRQRQVRGTGRLRAWSSARALPISAWALTGCLPAGYYGEGLSAIIVFAACFLPDSSSPDYHYLMEHLFL